MASLLTLTSFGDTVWIELRKTAPKHPQRAGLVTTKLGEADSDLDRGESFLCLPTRPLGREITALVQERGRICVDHPLCAKRFTCHLINPLDNPVFYFSQGETAGLRKTRSDLPFFFFFSCTQHHLCSFADQTLITKADLRALLWGLRPLPTLRKESPAPPAAEQWT